MLDYWQIFEGPGSTRPGPFLRRYGWKGIDTAGQVVLAPDGKLLAAHRSWKTGKGFTPEELRAWAKEHGRAGGRSKDALRLSDFLINESDFRKDMGGKDDVSGYCSANGAVQAARKMRRPLVRVDGEALDILEEHQEFLRRHVRQFWWHRGDGGAPGRLVVLNVHDIEPGARPTPLTGACSKGKVPAVMATLDLSGEVDLARISPVLDECWSRYMAERPSNADNLTFAKDYIPRFKAVDETVKALAREGALLAPGGRKLSAPEPEGASPSSPEPRQD